MQQHRDKAMPALRVSLKYAIFSILWILFSDQLLLVLVAEAGLMTKIQMVKGWIFVLVTSFIIFFLLFREIAAVRDAEKALWKKERDYQEIFNATNEAIALHDAETGAMVDVNHTFLKMFGYSYAETLVSSIDDLSEGDHPYTQEEAMEWIRRAVCEGPQLFEWHSRKSDGELFWAEITLKSTQLGGSNRVIAVIRDINDRKKAEEKSAEYEQRFRQTQKMEAIGTLAGGIAHDFNNILSAILGYTELAMLEISADSKIASHLEQVSQAGNRAKELVKQILTFTRQAKQEQVPVMISSVAKETLKLLRASIPTTIEIKQDIDNECGAVLADPTQLHQVFMNLCTNAYQAMRESGGELGVSLKYVDITEEDRKSISLEMTPGRYVKLAVSDTGIGMTRLTQEKIFDPYFTTKAKGEGTGMGLSVVHGIVNGLGGHLSVYSEIGIGSVFHVYLPAVPTTATLAETEAYRPLPRGDERILYVDDEQNLATLGGGMLESLGYTAVVCSDSREALETFLLDPDAFDLIITDMSMPQMNGIELARECFAIRPQIPVILCTGFSDLINREGALALGISEYLMKPMLTRDLAESVRRVLQREKTQLDRK